MAAEGQWGDAGLLLTGSPTPTRCSSDAGGFWWHPDQCREGSSKRTSCGEGWSICRVPVRGGGLMPKHVDPPRFIRLPQVREMTGLSTSTIYRWMTDGTFPKQIQLGSRSVVWNERDVINWMNAQISN